LIEILKSVLSGLQEKHCNVESINSAICSTHDKKTTDNLYQLAKSHGLQNATEHPSIVRTGVQHAPLLYP
jgi:hypothetical protein